MHTYGAWAARFEDLHKLHYVEMVIKEALRMFPSVPIIARILDEGRPHWKPRSFSGPARGLMRRACFAVSLLVHCADIVIEGHVVPRGMQVAVLIVAVHYDPLIWGDDADIFRPERCVLKRKGAGCWDGAEEGRRGVGVRVGVDVSASVGWGAGEGAGEGAGRPFPCRAWVAHVAAHTASARIQVQRRGERGPQHVCVCAVLGRPAQLHRPKVCDPGGEDAGDRHPSVR